MKKALAVVLAVMMLATLSFAVAIVNPSSSSVPGLPLVAGEENALQIPDEYFHSLYATPAINGKNWSVEGLNGRFAKVGTEMYIIPLTDPKAPWDGKADLNIGAFKIHYIEGGTEGTYVELGVKDNKLVLTSMHINGVEVPETDSKYKQYVTGLSGNELASAYDVGYEVKTASNLAGCEDKCWYKNTTGEPLTYDFLNDSRGKVTVTVPDKGVFYWNTADITPPTSPGDFTTILDKALNFKGDISIKYALVSPNGCNQCYYAVDKDGNVYNAGLTWTVAKNSVGVEKGAWKLETKAYPYGIYTNTEKLNVPDVPAAKAPADPKNPATGANDVVGVAAALAVVALVSGAAISLKK